MDKIKVMNNAELRDALIGRGFTPGPVVPTTRSLYERKLGILMGVCEPQLPVADADQPAVQADPDARETLVQRTSVTKSYASSLPSQAASYPEVNAKNCQGLGGVKGHLLFVIKLVSLVVLFLFVFSVVRNMGAQKPSDQLPNFE